MIGIKYRIVNDVSHVEKDKKYDNDSSKNLSLKAIL